MPQLSARARVRLSIWNEPLCVVAPPESPKWMLFDTLGDGDAKERHAAGKGDVRGGVVAERDEREVGRRRVGGDIHADAEHAIRGADGRLGERQPERAVATRAVRPPDTMLLFANPVAV